MASTRALVEKKNPKRERESGLAYRDRVQKEMRSKLARMKEWTEEQKEEFDLICKDIDAKNSLASGSFPERFADKRLMESMVERVRLELENEYGRDSIAKKLLLDRIVAAYNMSLSYDMLFKMAKYSYDKETGWKTYESDLSLKKLKEARTGIESTNDQIIRLLQALQNLTQPTLNVKAKNAFFAHNQQINQTPRAKDLDTVPRSSDADKTDY